MNEMPSNFNAARGTTLSVPVSKHKRVDVPLAKLDGPHLGLLQQYAREDAGGNEELGRKLFTSYVKAAIHSKTLAIAEGGPKPCDRHPDSRQADRIRRGMHKRF